MSCGYVLLFASGGVALEQLTPMRRRWVRPVAGITLVLSGLIALPLAKPILSEDRYIRYTSPLGHRPAAQERSESSRLPQFFAKIHGFP